MADTDNFNEDLAEETPVTENPGGDVEMAEGEEEAADGQTALPFADDEITDPPAPRVTFLNYLASPVVTLLVGHGKEETILTAHQGLLTTSPYFQEACAQFSDDGSVSFHAAIPYCSLRPSQYSLSILRSKC